MVQIRTIKLVQVRQSFGKFPLFSPFGPKIALLNSQTVKKGEYAALLPHTERNMKHESKPIRWDVFIPCFIVIGGAALLGIVNNAWLTNVTYAMFDWSLSTFVV